MWRCNILKYKNVGKVKKKFYNTLFKPGDVKSVDGYINDKFMIRVPDNTPETTSPQQSTKSAKVESSTSTVAITQQKSEPAAK